MTPDNGTLLATAMLPAGLVFSALLSALVSAWLLWLYRRAVLRGMARIAGVPSAAEATLPAPPPEIPLRIVPLEARAAPGPPPALALESARALRRAATAYGLAGLAYAVVLATPWMLFAGDGWSLGRWLWLLVCYVWPATLALGLVAAASPGERCRLVGAYALILAVVATFVLVRNPGLTPGQLAFFWLYANAPATLLLAAFLRRPVRAVGPLVFAFMAAVVTGAFLAVEAARHFEPVLLAMATVGSALGLGAAGTFLLLQLVGILAFGLLGRWLLGWVGERYRSRRTSDESLRLDALWLLFAVAQSFTFAFEGLIWLLAAPLAFVAYKGVATVALRGLARAPEQAACTLLVLRVFALGTRSQRLFDLLTTRWLRSGPITLIAGPDLVTRTAAPHEFLDFVGGRLAHNFVRGEADLARRLAQLEADPDPDGRYRVNELFCHADTWQAGMRALAARSDAILMDLRSFSAGNQGCIYELSHLLDRVDLNRVVFVVDASTDTPLLERTFAALWRRTAADSPNRRAAAPTARLLKASGATPGVLRGLLRELYASARPA